jgi:hypothetical protein
VRAAAAAAPSAATPAAAAGDPVAEEGRLRAAGFSPQAIAAAHAIGAGPVLLRLVAPEAAAPRRGRGEEALWLRQAATEAIVLGQLEVAGTIAEIDCEGERGDQLRVRLQAALDRRARVLGVATILAGAATAALTGGLSIAGAATAGNIAGIAGGATEAGLATTLLFGEARGELRTPRNLLGEVWRRPERPVLIPGSVWRYLTRRDPGEPEAPSRLDRLLAEWRVPELLGAPGSETERRRAELLFGDGGAFTPGDLEIRDAMLDLLETTVALMNQDLRALLLELGARHPAAAPGQGRGARGRATETAAAASTSAVAP